MYYSHFGLKEPPFKITPNTEYFFSGGNRGAVLDALVYAITSGEGIVKVVGEVGSGKTMLCRMLEGMLPENIERIYLANPSVAPEDILHAIAFELQLDLPSDADRLLVMQTLHQHLIERHTQGHQVVIFVEEAQGMPLATLEEIRLLSNLETRHSKLLQIVLFGQPELDVNLNMQHIRQLKERITHSFDLGPLKEQDIEDYLISRLRTAGYFGPPLFTRKAVSKMAKASKGLVRRVNILADKALLAAFAENAYSITPKHVSIAINDSEFGSEDTTQSSSKKACWLAMGGLALGLGIGFGAPFIKPFIQPAKPLAQKFVIAAPPAKKTEPAVSAANAPTVAPQPAPPAASVQATPTASPNIALDPANASTAAPPQTSPPPPSNIVDARLIATKAWLAQQPSSTVSIQLMVGDNAEQMRTQLEGLTSMVEVDNLFVYRTNVGGKPYISVLYGSFPDRTTASKALSELPKPLRTYKPQLRTIGGITEEIKQLQ